MTGYTKLFGSLIGSTIWREEDHVRLVWITMLALKDRRQMVEASVPGLADFARVPIAKCVQALKVLSAPDEFSRSKEHEGRRIREVEGGWLILNGEKYREKMNADERREANRIYQKRWREKNFHNNSQPIAGQDGYEKLVKDGASQKELDDYTERVNKEAIAARRAQRKHPKG